ncbi:MAG: amidophosphoribosyltransferase [Lentisphaeria bacterium]
MGGFFGVVGHEDCVADLFYGTDYHSHLGNMCGGLLVKDKNDGLCRIIHRLRHDQFRAKFDGDLEKLHGNSGIGCISDSDSQPLIIKCKFGSFGITTVGLISNLDELQNDALQNHNAHYVEMYGNDVSPTELVARLISLKDNFADGIQYAQDKIKGSCSMLILAEDGALIAARDRWGRTPIVLGEKDGAYAAAFESCSLYNLGYKILRWLGPGEVVRMTPDSITTILPPRKQMKFCAFLWIYYGFPASSYENINVEHARYNCGAMLAKRDKGLEVDTIAGIPDSGTAHALGYANESHVPYMRSYVKYTPTWARSFISDRQDQRLHVAKMKLIPILDFIKGKKLLFCEDSIVRGTQLRDTFARLPELGAKEVHMRSACPPIMYGCKYLNFSPSRTPMELIARRAVAKLEGSSDAHLDEYTDSSTCRYKKMIESIRKEMGLASLKYQTFDDMIKAIGFPKEKLCTYCWNGKE